MFDLYRRHPDFFRNMVGLYPGSVDEDWEKDVADAESHARDAGVVAIGEIGLDYHYSKDTAELQKEALEAQFRLADKLDLPVNIHERWMTFSRYWKDAKGSDSEAICTRTAEVGRRS